MEVLQYNVVLFVDIYVFSPQCHHMSSQTSRSPPPSNSHHMSSQTSWSPPPPAMAEV